MKGRKELQTLLRSLTYSVDKMTDAEKNEAIEVLRNRVHEIANNNQHHMDLLAKFIFKCSKEYHEAALSIRSQVGETDEHQENRTRHISAVSTDTDALYV